MSACRPAGGCGPAPAGGIQSSDMHLRLLRQIGDELIPGVEQFLLVDDVVTARAAA